MKLTNIHNDRAEKIIVEGENKSFTVFSLDGQVYTIYHRIYKGEYYDVLEMITKSNDVEITTFYLLDPDEVKELLKNLK